MEGLIGPLISFIGAVLIGAAFWSSLRHNRLSAGGG